MELGYPHVTIKGMEDVHEEHIYADAKQAEENDSLESSDQICIHHKDDPDEPCTFCNDDHDCHAGPESGCECGEDDHVIDEQFGE